MQSLDDGAEKRMRRGIVFPAPGGPPLKLIKAVGNKTAVDCVSPAPGATSRLFIFIFTAARERRPDMEMSVRQPLCRRANGAFELCVWRAEDAPPPPITCPPSRRHLRYLTLELGLWISSHLSRPPVEHFNPIDLTFFSRFVCQWKIM